MWCRCVWAGDQATPSLFAKCGHSLQVDGALGMSAAISELLVQSHLWCGCDEVVQPTHACTDGHGYLKHRVIDVLPALPSQWVGGACTPQAAMQTPTSTTMDAMPGSFTGVRARGAFALDVTWHCSEHPCANTDVNPAPPRAHPDYVAVVVTSCARVARPCVLRVAWACRVTVECLPSTPPSTVKPHVLREHENLPAHACVALHFDETTFDCRYKVVFSAE